jgi:hypothetical protein
VCLFAIERNRAAFERARVGRLLHLLHPRNIKTAGLSLGGRAQKPAVEPSGDLHYTARNILLPLRFTSKRMGASFGEAPTAWA